MDDAIENENASRENMTEEEQSWLNIEQPETYLCSQENKISYRELISFSNASTERAIPSVVDGLKPGQRKILFSSFKKNLVNELEVYQFAGYVREHSAYHHSEQCLTESIIGMAQDFVGSNNINMFQPNGIFGSRYEGGKDHGSAKYLYTELSPITRCVFMKEDDILLDYLSEDGLSVEPKWYIPIVPMILINGVKGVKGVGTGYSSFVPNFNPDDIIHNLKCLLTNAKKDSKLLVPWYKGFTGKIEEQTKKGKTDEQSKHKSDTCKSYTCSGTITSIGDRKFEITELPIRRWTDGYKQFLYNSVIGSNGKNQFLQKYKNYSDTKGIKFRVTLKDGHKQIVDEDKLNNLLKLSTSISTSNMHLYDQHGNIKKYASAEEILADFYVVRLEYYKKRKEVILENLKAEKLKVDNMIKWIKEILAGTFGLTHKTRVDVINSLKEMGVQPFLEKIVKAKVTVGEDVEAEEDPYEGIGRDYDCLVLMRVVRWTPEECEKLSRKRDMISKKMEEMEMVTPETLWMRDLENLQKQLENMRG